VAFDLLRLLQGKFDPQALHMRGVLWMLSGGAVLASLEEPQAGLALTGRLFCVEGETHSIQLWLLFAFNRQAGVALPGRVLLVRGEAGGASCLVVCFGC
jgi:hypothetical protein